ncbi:Hydantoinase B/oxoprolinase-domain-containing protein [Aspergillus multicolor]|uniref:Hydantoinase B/oxoprolinase-domain-containing protein n=1 Tax=Aspergillus multicolor TaxID=41759 RepID=UPI003CCE1A26
MVVSGPSDNSLPEGATTASSPRPGFNRRSNQLLLHPRSSSQCTLTIWSIPRLPRYFTLQIIQEPRSQSVAAIGGTRSSLFRNHHLALFRIVNAGLGLVKEGVFDEEGLAEIILRKPATYPGCTVTRTWSDNVNDLKAQVAANWKGIKLSHGSIREYGIPTVQRYMKRIQNNAEKVVRDLLRSVHDQFSGLPLQAVDYMDNGPKLCLQVKINREDSSATFDFTGTPREMYGKLSALKAITFSATIYALRSLVTSDIPLNQGCPAPIEVILPESTILSVPFIRRRISRWERRNIPASHGPSPLGLPGKGPTITLHSATVDSWSTVCPRQGSPTRDLNISVLSGRRTIAPYDMCSDEPRQCGKISG